jgi:predicted GNAT family N-acyltransferase
MHLIDSTYIRRATLTEIIDLRHAVLRAGLPRESAIFPGDELSTTRHFGAFTGADARAVACATFHLNQWNEEPAWQLRGMATADDCRGTGLGRKILEFSEGELVDDPNVTHLFWCNARVPALGFYQRMGWEVVSEPFEIPTAGPHVKMLRRLLG